VSTGLAAAPITSAWSVWGGTAVVAVLNRDRLELARSAVEETIEAFDRACSTFRADSELSRVNAAGGAAVAIGPVLRDAVAAALRAAAVTDGDVDPTVGGALVALGLDREFGSASSPPTVSFAVVPGWRSVALDPRAGTIRLAPGVRLDLGATAKALAADRAAAAAHEAAGGGVLVGLGGDVAVAGAAPAGGWPVRVTDDHRSGLDARGQSIAIADGGLATSSIVARGHHIVDPRTGAPASDVWRTVSVTAASCLDANIASTAALIRGGAAVAWLSSLGLAARLVSADGRATHVGGWPADGEELV
jgi:thiamine biosynthesis lipoprotein